MQVHAEHGDVAGALRIYKALWDLLDEDYGMEPSAATQDLVAKVKLGEFERPRVGIDDRRVADARLSTPINGSVAAVIPSATAEIKAPLKTCLVLRPFAMHGIDSDHAHLVQ